jgi:hypothetical protein
LTSSPLSQSRCEVEDHIAFDLCQFMLAPIADAKVSRIILTYFRFFLDSFKYRFVSSTNSQSVIVLMFLCSMILFTSFVFYRRYPKQSTRKRYKNSANGQPCLTILDNLKASLVVPLSSTLHTNLRKEFWSISPIDYQSLGLPSILPRIPT